MTKKKFGKGMPAGTSHQTATTPAATASQKVQQLGASAPCHVVVMVAPGVRLSVVTESLLWLWRSIQGGFVTETLLGLWRSIQGGVERLIRFILRRRDAGVVHPSAPPPSNTPGGVNPSAASRSNAPGGDGRAQCRAGWNAFAALHRTPAAAAAPEEPQPPDYPPPSPFQEQPQPQQPQAPPHPFQMVDGELVSDEEQLQQPQAPPHPFQMVDGELISNEELAMYVDYCQARSTSGKKAVCHMCIFVDRKYYSNKFKPSNVLIHCTSIHKTPGLECEDGDCMVRVTTRRELRLHKHFCHNTPIDWWQH